MKKIRAAFMLVVTTFFWGVTFTIVKDAINQVDVFVFLSQRFLLSAGIMLPWAFLRRKQFNFNILMHGVVLGFLLFACYAFRLGALGYLGAEQILAEMVVPELMPVETEPVKSVAALVEC